VLELARNGVSANSEWTPTIQSIDGVSMALVPAGCFQMGSSETQLQEAQFWCDKFNGIYGCKEDFGVEQPEHEVCFDQPFFIDQVEVSNRAYGEMPNMVYVIGKDGRIFYKAMWTNHEEIESVLEGMARFDEASQAGVRRMPFYSERLSFRGGYNSGAGVDVLGRAGPKAKADFASAIPGPRPGGHSRRAGPTRGASGPLRRGRPARG